MMKRFSHFAACLLLVLMPLQALAAANLMVCNSLMQASTTEKSVQVAEAMPCHQVAKEANSADQVSDDMQSKVCKARCATLCASMLALTVNIQTELPKNLSTAIDAYPVSYTSIAQQRLQRPPISFI